MHHISLWRELIRTISLDARHIRARNLFCILKRICSSNFFPTNKFEEHRFEHNNFESPELNIQFGCTRNSRIIAFGRFRIQCNSVSKKSIGLSVTRIILDWQLISSGCRSKFSLKKIICGRRLAVRICGLVHKIIYMCDVRVRIHSHSFMHGTYVRPRSRLFIVNGMKRLQIAH